MAVGYPVEAAVLFIPAVRPAVGVLAFPDPRWRAVSPVGPAQPLTIGDYLTPQLLIEQFLALQDLPIEQEILIGTPGRRVRLLLDRSAVMQAQVLLTQAVSSALQVEQRLTVAALPLGTLVASAVTVVVDQAPGPELVRQQEALDQVPMLRVVTAQVLATRSCTDKLRR